MRVSSVTLPSSIGTLRSTRTSTRLPFTSASSSVRNAVMADGLSVLEPVEQSRIVGDQPVLVDRQVGGEGAVTAS